jgi:hypothetical protein
MTGYWSLAGYAKRKVKTALNFIFDFEESALTSRPRARAGRRHLRPYPLGADPRDRRPDLRQLRRLGRFSCTAIVEHFDGRLELVAWGMRR